MNKTIFYTVLMATLSILVFQGLALDADAKTVTKDSTLKGDYLDFNQDRNSSNGIDKINLIIRPNMASTNDSTNLSVKYTVRDGTGIIAKGDCTSSKQIVKISGQNKASVEFDISDLDCGSTQTGVMSGVISASLKSIEDSATKKKTEKTERLDCNEPDNN